MFDKWIITMLNLNSDFVSWWKSFYFLLLVFVIYTNLDHCKSHLSKLLHMYWIIVHYTQIV